MVQKRENTSILSIIIILVCLIIQVICIADMVDKLNNGVYADIVTIPNDGSPTDTPYGDSYLPNSYSGADYYDCYIPYCLSIKDIGGWANNYYDCKKTAYAYSMSDYPRRLEYKIGCSTMTREGDKTTGQSYHGATLSEDSLGMDVFTDSNGNQYYGCALPFFFYNFGGLSMSGGSSFPEWGLGSNGQAFDMILTDGTCIHFLVVDHKAIAHTNWGNDGVSPKNDDVRYKYDPIIYSQYANIFQAANGETFELWGGTGCASNFMSAYNISATGNKVAVIRMYNIDLDSTTPTRESNVGTSVSYKMADSVSVTSVGGSQTTGGNSLLSTGSSLVAEWELVGMPTRNDLSDLQSIINLPSRENMGITDSSAVALIGENIDLVKKASLFDNMRVSIVFIGLVVVLYGLFLLLGLLFDKANTILDISMISLLTFGKLHFNPWEDGDFTQSPKGYASTKKIVVIAVVVITVGLLLISSSLTKLIGKVMYWLFSKAL